jgi:beta-lactamase class D
VDFLDRLRRGALPASAENQARVCAMMRHGPNSNLFVKTGATLPIDPVSGDIVDDPAVLQRLEGLERTAWYVGWVKRSRAQGGDAIFAFNMAFAEMSELGERAVLARRLLSSNGVLVSE